MRAIYAAFVDQEIACNDPVVQDDLGCANKPVDRPLVTATSGDKFVRLNWSAVGNAASYDVMRAEGGCEKGKVKVANQLSGNRTFQDNGLKNGFEVSVPTQIVSHQRCHVPLTNSSLSPRHRSIVTSLFQKGLWRAAMAKPPPRSKSYPGMLQSLSRLNQLNHLHLSQLNHLQLNQLHYQRQTQSIQ